MSITIPRPLIPILTKPKLPGWVALTALVLQYALIGSGSNSNSECEIKVQEVHLSTYSNEYRKIEEIKLKVSTRCDSPQLTTKVRGAIFKEQPNGSYVNVYTFDEALGRPELNSPNFVIIESLAIPCPRLGDGKYLGSATALVNLKNRKTISLSGISIKPRTIECETSAK
jgi:hypothetical protein